MEELGGSNHAMRQRCLGAPLLLLMALLFGRPARGDQFTYLIIDHPAATNYTSLSAINNSGQIVGQYSDKAGVHGFLYSGGIFTTIDVPNVSSTTLTGINDAGQIVGFYNQDSFLPHSFLYSGAGFTPINVPGADYTYANGINDAGQIVGTYVTGAYIPGGGITHGFLYSGGVFTALDAPGADHTEAKAINKTSEIVGFTYDTNNTFQPFLYSDGNFIRIANLPSELYVYFTGINDAGQIVGNTAEFGPFLYSGATFTPVGGVFDRAGGINNAGEIVGYYDEPFGHLHGFLAVPVPEPTPVTSLIGAALAIVLFRTFTGGWRLEFGKKRTRFWGFTRPFC